MSDITRFLFEEPITGDTVWKVVPGRRYMFNVGDGGSAANIYLQYWDGAAWVNYPDSDGSASQGFGFYAPATGQIRLEWGAGTAIVSMWPIDD